MNKIELFCDENVLELFWAAQDAQKDLSAAHAALLAALDALRPGAGELLFGDAPAPTVSITLTPTPGVVEFDVRTPHPDPVGDDERNYSGSPLCVAIGKALSPGWEAGFIPKPATPRELIEALARLDVAAIAATLVEKYASYLDE